MLVMNAFFLEKVEELIMKYLNILQNYIKNLPGFWLFLLSCYAIFSGFIHGAEQINSREAWAKAYGNKTANLMELRRIVKELEPIAQQYKLMVSIPDIFGVSHQHIVDFLMKYAISTQGNDLVPTWQYVNQEWASFKIAQQSAEAQKLSPQSKIHLSNIRNAITEAFSMNVFDFQSNLELSQKYEEFINHMAFQHYLLMVRSTGREDNIDFANAGGNESVAAVHPIKEAISKAMAVVVSSYFSEKSIGQRLAAEDKHLYDDPFVPVLLQLMVGERPGFKDSIPVSGVMFSQEAEGRTPGVTRIDATWGAGEGVVNGLVGVDTFYVGPTNDIHPLIHIKRERMRTDEFNKLISFPNRLSLQKRPALSPLECRTLASIAKEIEKHYGAPQDIEFVVVKKEIYIVQTRSLPGPRIIPSYIKQDYLNHVQSKEVFCIGSAGGAVRFISNKGQLIVAKTLKIALDRYLDHPQKKSIEVIIVSEMAPATSHEATNFRGAGKPVLFMNDASFVDQQLNKGNQIFVDTQRSLIVPYIPSDAFPDFKSAIHENAWYSHPIAQKVSVETSFLPFFEGSDAGILEFGAIYKGWTTSKPNLFMKFHTVGFSALFNQLAIVQSEQELDEVIHALVFKVHQTIDYEKKLQEKLIFSHMATDVGLLARLDQIEKCIRTSVKELIETFRLISSWPESPEKRLQWLYPMVFLKAFIHQLPLQGIFVADYSLGSTIKTEQQEQKIVKDLQLKEKVWRAYTVQLAKVLPQSLTGEVADAWQKYLTSLPRLDNIAQAGLINLVVDLNQAGIMPLWLNLNFMKIFAKASGPEELTKNLIKEYLPSRDIVRYLSKIKQSLQNFPVNKFSEPALFEKLWKSLDNEFLAQFIAPVFATQYDQYSELARYAILMVLSNVIDALDLSIKTLESSQEYSDQELKARRFKQMVERSCALFKNLVAIPSISSQLNKMVSFSFTVSSQQYQPIITYVNHIEQIIALLPAQASQLKPSRSFNVAGASLGSHSNWARSTGGSEGNSAAQDALRLTLDDMFTLAHQNSLVVLGVLYSKTDINSLQLSDLVKSANLKAGGIRVALALSGGTNYQNSSLIGFNIGSSLVDKNLPQITYYYNLPAKNHSNTFQVIYDHGTKQTRFDIQFIGDARIRWPQFSRWSILFSLLSGIELAKEPEIDKNRGILKLSFTLTKHEQVGLLFRFITKLVEYTVGERKENEVYVLLRNVLGNQIVENALKNNVSQFFEKITKQVELMSIIPLFITMYPGSPIAHKLFDKIREFAVWGTEEEALSLVEVIVESFRTMENYSLRNEKINSLYADDVLAIASQVPGKISHNGNEKHALDTTYEMLKSASWRKDRERNNLYSNYLAQFKGDNRWQFQYITSKIFEDLLDHGTGEELLQSAENFVRMSIESSVSVVLEALLALLVELVKKERCYDLISPLIEKICEVKKLELPTIMNLRDLVFLKADLLDFKIINHRKLLEKLILYQLELGGDVDVDGLLYIGQNSIDSKQVYINIIDAFLSLLKDEEMKTLSKLVNSATIIANFYNALLSVLDIFEAQQLAEKIVDAFDEYLKNNKDEGVFDVLHQAMTFIEGRLQELGGGEIMKKRVHAKTPEPRAEQLQPISQQGTLQIKTLPSPTQSTAEMSPELVRWLSKPLLPQEQYSRAQVTPQKPIGVHSQGRIQK